MGEFTDKAKGEFKKNVGKVKQQSNDPETRNDGRKDEAEGHIDKAKGDVKGKINKL